MKAYIVYADYEIKGDKPVINLYGRLKNGESFWARTTMAPYFYIRKSDLSKARKVLEPRYDDPGLKDFDENKVLRVFVTKPTEVPQLKKMYEDKGITTYEADIRFVQRYYIDNDILGTVEIKGEHQEGEYVDRIFDDPDIKAITPYDPQLEVLSIDIETDIKAKRIYSISLVGRDVEEVHIITDKKLKHAVSYKDEDSLLKGFISRVRELDPDILIGWNVIDFDLKVLRERFRHYEIPFTLGRSDREAVVRAQSDFLRESTAKIPGRIVFDGISLLKQAFLSYEDYKLGTVAKEVLGEDKVTTEEDFFDDFEKTVREDPKKVVEYNLKDSKLVLDIVKKKKLTELMVKKSLITGLQLDRVKGSVAALDSLYIRRATKKGYVSPNSYFGDRDERVKGALVLDPKPGIYEYIAVLDFKSLYPSIMITYNIDPIAFKDDGEIEAPNGARFRNDNGVLAEIIQASWDERDKAKKEKDETKSYAIKVIMNSFYGVLANPMCRYYSLDMANAITSFARETIKKTKKHVEKQGYKVLYGDTDSVFVDTDSSSIKDVVGKANSISKEINELFQKELERYKRRSSLCLEFEKVFKVLMLPKIRSGEGGAKKRYAGLAVKEGKEEISVTGMEFVRRDWTELSKRVQMELLDRVFHKKEVSGYLQKLISELKEGRYDDLLVYRKALRKDLDEYTKTTPPHVKAARMLSKITSNIIEYYMTTNGPEPKEKLKSPIDYDHYIEKQIKPIAETILGLYDMDFDDVVRNSKQKSIFDY